MKLTVLATALLLTATGAVAAPPAEQSAPAEQAASTATNAADDGAEAQEEKKVCRTERATGSLTRRTRVCMTAAQWREINSKTYKGVTEMQGSASGSQAVVNNAGPGG